MIKISSKDRATGSSSSDFTIQMADSIDPGTYKLVYTAIPLTFYNITASNNKVYFLENAVPFTATVTPGNYSASTIGAALSTALDAAGAYTYTVAIDSNTEIVTITSSDAKASFSDGTNSINTTIGFPASTAAGLTHTGTSMLNLSQVRNLHICIDRDSPAKDSTNRRFTFILPVIGGFKEWMYRTEKDINDQHITISREAKNLRISLRDDNLQEVNLNGLDWDFVIKCCC